MAQTELDYNSIALATKDHALRYGSITITSGAGSLSAGTILVLNSSNTYDVWDSETTTIDSTDVDTTSIAGMVILLEDADASSAAATAKVLKTGGVHEGDLILAGSTITTVTERVKASLRMNGIEVISGTSSIYEAGV